MSIRAATADFWQARPPCWGSHHRRVAVAAATLYSAKSRLDCGLGGLASRDGPEKCDEQINKALEV